MGAPDTYTLITGASSGIGRAIAQKLAPTHKLILLGRNVEKLEETRAACTNPNNHVLWACDLKASETLESNATLFLQKQRVQIDAFVHAAGVSLVVPMRLVSFANTDEVMRVNFTSAVMLSSVLLRNRANGSSLKSMVFISSIASRFGVRGFNIYSASKGALDSMMKSLAVELAPTVRVNSVLPGGLLTGGNPQLTGNTEVLRRLKEEVPLGLGTTEDIAAMVEFLLSDKARWITGQQIVVDGGFTVNATL